MNPNNHFNPATSEDIVIYGSGAMAETLFSYIVQDHNVIAFVCEDEYCLTSNICHLPLIPLSEFIHQFSNKDVTIAIAVGFSEMNDIRKRITDTLKNQGFKLFRFIHKSFELHRNVTVGEFGFILNNTTIHCNSRIGDSVFIASGVNIGHDCVVGDYSWLNSGVSLAGGVSIGEHCFMGVNACVAHGVSVAPYTYIGANTLVTKNTQLGDVVVTQAGEIFDFDSKAYLAWLK